MKIFRYNLFLTVACLTILSSSCVNAADNSYSVASLDSTFVSGVVKKQHELQSRFDSLENHISNMEEKVDSLNSSVIEMKDAKSSNLNLVFILLVVISLGLAVYIFIDNQKMKKKYIEIINKGDLQNSNSIKEIQESLNQLSNWLHTVQQSISTTKISNVQQENYLKQDNSIVTRSMPKQSTISAASQPASNQKINKYVDFTQDIDGKMKVLPRSISDQSNGKWFVISYNENSCEASYSINPESKQSMLSDLNTLRLSVEKFTNIVNPCDIEVVTPGHLIKKGNMWEVSEKLIIKLV